MGNAYGNAYKNLREKKSPHTVTREDLKDFKPEFVVASSHPKRLTGRVEIYSDFDKERLVEWVDRSRVRYEVSWFVSPSENGVVFKSYDIEQALEFYNNF